MNEEELKRRRFDQIQLYRERFSREKLAEEDAEELAKALRKNNWRNRKDLKDKIKSDE